MKKAVKKSNKLKYLIVTLVVVLISLISFVGIYTKKQGNYINSIEEYSLGMSLKGNRTVIYNPDESSDEDSSDTATTTEETTENEESNNDNSETVNKEEILTEENFKKSKDIIIKRLNEYNYSDYAVRLDKESGKIIVQLDDKDTEETNDVISLLSQQGKFEIKDSETDEVLIDNSMVKDAKVMYNTSTTGTSVYLNIVFNKEGKEKLKQVSTDYRKTEESTDESEESTDESEESADETENTSTESEEKTGEETSEDKKEKEIKLEINGEEVLTTGFEQTIENGSLPLTVGQASTDNEKVQKNVKDAQKMSIVLSNGMMPVKYTSDNNKYYKASISNNSVKCCLIISIVIIVIISVVLIIKYKSKGFMATILSIGFIAISLLIIRYTNVAISVNGLIALPIIVLLNYAIEIALIINSNKKEEERKSFLEILVKVFFVILPLLVVSISYSFAKTVLINSFGMILFWGILITMLYNLIIAKVFGGQEAKDEK